MLEAAGMRLAQPCARSGASHADEEELARASACQSSHGSRSRIGSQWLRRWPRTEEEDPALHTVMTFSALPLKGYRAF